MAFINAGDTLVVPSLDRLSRSLLCTHQLLRIEAACAAADASGPGPAEAPQIGFTTLVQRLRDAVIRTGSRGQDPDQTLHRLREATREDVTPIDPRIRVYDRVIKYSVARYRTKKPDQHGHAVLYEYTIEPAGIPVTSTTTTPPRSIVKHPALTRVWVVTGGYYRM